ncbi:seryl-tRNA synthetase [Sphingomonas jejuensis]|uniref:Serine--tRNA ligase n=1 Tax=Sphingomonas jejuensis TaxID=904715 RepID=A0ABX0XJX0_9SPHN|nr:serine--tRNA ligase [Sphingomonas jejuensis]NJC33535.1 seryl-tRNA synthetase [Sphingomonas jejuensis]
MHDPRAVRDDPAAFDLALERRGAPPAAGAILALDDARKAAATALQVALARRNEASKAIGAAKAGRREEEAQALMAEVSALKETLPAIEEDGRAADRALADALAALPNRVADDVPPGRDEHDNLLVHERGRRPQFDFPPREHDAVAEQLGLDFETAGRLSGSRFAVMRGPVARLHRALGQFMLDRQVAAGWEEVVPPVLVRGDALFGTGQLPKFADDLFKVEGEDRWLIPTAEVSLTNIVRERILDADALPLRFTALTPCFRAEAGAAGRDTKGLIRQHQFEKVELVSIVAPEAAAEEHERMTVAAEAILDALELPYRRMLLCAGDMGFSARRTFDLEVWLPGQDRYREISSISDCGDFQARRMEARMRIAGEKGTRFVHTLNGSGLAVGRALVAVIENGQRADGSVELPPALRPYLGTDRLEPRG